MPENQGKWLDINAATENDYISRLLPWVKTIVSKVCPVKPVEDTEEYSDALLGVLKAYRKFDRTRGLQFMTFALHKIRGEVLDGIRNRNEQRRKSKVGLKFRSLSRSRVADCIECHHDFGELERSEELAEVFRAIESLEPEMQIGVKSIMTSETYPEHAKRFGVTDVTLRTWRVRGFAALKGLYRDGN